MVRGEKRFISNLKCVCRLFSSTPHTPKDKGEPFIDDRRNAKYFRPERQLSSTHGPDPKTKQKTKEKKETRQSLWRRPFCFFFCFLTFFLVLCCVFIMHGTRKNREFYLRVWRSSFLSFFFQCKIKSFYRLLWRTHRCQFERTTRNKQIKISSFSDFNEWMKFKNIWKHQYIVSV